MKKLYLVMIALVPLLSSAQKIKLDEIDKFTKKHTVITDYVTLKRTMTGYIKCRFKAIDTLLGVSFHGGNMSVGVVGDDEESILLLSDSSTITVHSTGIQTYDIEGYGNKIYDHTYVIAAEDLHRLAEKELISIRFYLTDSYSDIDINNKNAKQLKELATLFLSKL